MSSFGIRMTNGVSLGESWKRFRFLQEMLEAAPPFNELMPGNSMLVKDGACYLVYCAAAGSKTVQLSGTKPYKVDCLDMWEMTSTPVGTTEPGAYTFSAPEGDVIYRLAP